MYVPNFPLSFHRFGRFPDHSFPVASIDVIQRAVGEYRWDDCSPQAVSLSLTPRVQDSDRVFLAAGMSQTQGVLPQKTQRKYLVDDPSHRLAWASWLRTCVTRTLPFIFRRVEIFSIQYHRTSPYDSILGGAEDVMGDLGVRQALRKMPQNARL
jgi:hypothetical protein